MPGYITYMKITLNPTGASPREITDILRNYGWKPVYGTYDYAYTWGPNWGSKDTNIQEFFEHTNKTHEALKGCHVNYSLYTYEQGKEDFFVKWSE